MENLDGYACLSLVVASLPHYAEAAASDAFEQQVSAISERVASLELPTFPQASTELEDLAIDLAQLGAQRVEAGADPGGVAIIG